jgi:hypothetical protein
MKPGRRFCPCRSSLANKFSLIAIGTRCGGPRRILRTNLATRHTARSHKNVSDIIKNLRGEWISERSRVWAPPLRSRPQTKCMATRPIQQSRRPCWQPAALPRRPRRCAFAKEIIVGAVRHGAAGSQSPRSDQRNIPLRGLAFSPLLRPARSRRVAVLPLRLAPAPVPGVPLDKRR